MSTLLHRLYDWALANPEAPAQWYKKDGQWQVISARDFWQRVFHLALFLEHRGFKVGDITAIFSYNCPQWVQTDLASLLLRGLSAGIYPNVSLKDIQYILDNTQSAVLAVQNRDYFVKAGLAENPAAMPVHIRLILVFDGDASFSTKAVTYQEALTEGQGLAQGKQADAYLASLEAQAGAFLIYTSGTTGHPKGAMLSHDNMVFTSDQIIAQAKIPTAGRMFSFLPLCHIAEKLQNVGIGISTRNAVYYGSKFENMSAELPEVKPTMLLCVPRVWEKTMEGVQHHIARSKPLQRWLATWALHMGTRMAQAQYARRCPSPFLRLGHWLAKHLVLLPIRRKIGVDQCQLFASGAAPLHPHVSRWFRALDIEIREAFGQTESTGVICFTESGVDSAGTVGKPLPDVEFKLAEDGEILTRGRHVFKGYWRNDEATRATIADGWLCTGDLGEINERGLVRIIGRKKEIMKTSGGKMIAPAPIEEKIKECPYIGQACMVGDGRKYFTALTVLKGSILANNKLPGEDGIARIAPEVVQVIEQHMEWVNQERSSYEQIKYFAILAREFSVESGELTPTMKMKRNVVEKRYQAIIECMYRESDLEGRLQPPRFCPLSCTPENCFCRQQGVRLEICQTKPALDKQ
jgi:long-chain acyl-CoA synthetase